jgi:branched-chain amino acid transport system ATP-binding protein
VSSTATTSGATSASGGPDADGHDVVFDVRGITLRFGGVTSLDDVSLQMRRGEILAVIGPNGAGKTSLFNSLTGVYTPQEGEILLAARPGDTPVSVLGKKTHVVNHLGVARTFQNIRLFPALTALENVKVGVETRQRRSGPVSAMLGLPWQRREERESTEAAYALLDRVGLADRANELASSLAYGEQRRLEIARALGTRPGVILLDEPAAGTNPAEKRDLAALIRQINDDGIGVLLIEHDMKLVMSVADRIVVLNFGRRIAEGTPEQIQRDPAVVAAYLGTSAEEAEQELATHERPELHTIDTSGGVGGAVAAPAAPVAGTDEPGGEKA